MVSSIHPPSESNKDPLDYESVNALAAKLDRPASTLIALSPHNDPFFAARPGRKADAEWFADIWERFRFGDGTHLRRIHYRLISTTTPILMRDSKPYRN